MKRFAVIVQMTQAAERWLEEWLQTTAFASLCVVCDNYAFLHEPGGLLPRSNY